MPFPEIVSVQATAIICLASSLILSKNPDAPAFIGNVLRPEFE